MVVQDRGLSIYAIMVILIVFIIKLDWSVCTCLTQLYDGRDMYIIYYIKNSYMFWYITLAVFRLRNEKTWYYYYYNPHKSSIAAYLRTYSMVQSPS